MTKEELEKEATEWVRQKFPMLDLKQSDMSKIHEYEAYIASAEPREKRIAELEKENAELKAKIYGGGYEAVITKKDADIILLEHLLKEQKELHKSVCNQLTHTHKNLRNQLTYAKTSIQDLLDNTDEYARQRAEDFLKEE